MGARKCRLPGSSQPAGGQGRDPTTPLKTLPISSGPAGRGAEPLPADLPAAWRRLAGSPRSLRAEEGGTCSPPAPSPQMQLHGALPLRGRLPLPPCLVINERHLDLAQRPPWGNQAISGKMGGLPERPEEPPSPGHRAQTSSAGTSGPGASCWGKTCPLLQPLVALGEMTLLLLQLIGAFHLFFLHPIRSQFLCESFRALQSIAFE